MKPTKKAQTAIDNFEKAVKNNKDVLLHKRILEKLIMGLESDIMAHIAFQRAQARKHMQNIRAHRSHIEEQDAHITILSRGKGV